MAAATEDPAAPEVAHRLLLLGAVHVVIDGCLVDLGAGDPARLMTDLAIHPGVQPREVVGDRLWPEAGPAARRKLNDTIYRLRRTVGDGWLVTTAGAVGLADTVWVDATAFGLLAASRERHELERAIELYAGDLAPAIYDESVFEPREWHRRALAHALVDLIEQCEQSGELDVALGHARRLVSLDSLDEGAHRAYLRALGRLHRYGEAAAHYESLVEQLAREVGVAPATETTALANRLAAEREVAIDVPMNQTRFVGRADERRSAIEAVEAMFARHGGIWCVQGSAGIGKSRLIDELVHSARWRGAHVLRAAVEPTPEASPLAPLERALGPVLTHAVRTQIDARLDTTTRRALAPLHPTWAVPAPDAGPGSTNRSHTAFRVMGATVAGLGPTVLVIDDLHWADRTLWQALDGFADGFVPGGGLLVGGFRHPEIKDGRGWELLDEWDRRGLVTVCSLEPLTLDEVAELVGDLQSPAAVHALTGGVPFYIEQWLRSPRGDPAGRDRIVDGRLEMLPPPVRQSLDGAAVLGSRVDARAWTDVCDVAPLELAPISEHLVHDGWLVPTVDGHVFAHDILHSAVYERIGVAKRIALHRRAVETVRRIEPNNTRTLAFHLDEAGAAADAAAAYRVTAATLRAEFAFDAAAQAWSRALDLLSPTQARDRLDVALDLAEVCDVISDMPRQQPVLHEATALARRLGDRPALLRALTLAGGAAARAGDPDSATPMLAEAARLAHDLGDALSHADVLFRTGDLLIQTGRWAEGDLRFADGLALLDVDENPWLYCRLLRGRAICAVRTGRPAEAATLLEQALSTFQAGGDRLNEMVTLTSLFSAYYDQGLWDALESAIEKAGPIAHDLGDLVNIGLVHQARGLAALALGDRLDARTQLVESQRCFEAAGRPRLVGSTIDIRGLVAADDDELDEAEGLFREAITMALASHATTEVAYARHDLGALLLRATRADDAVAELRSAADHWKETGHPMLWAKSSACLGVALLDAGRSRDEPVAIADAGLELLRSGTAVGEQPQAWLWHLAELLRRLDRSADRADVLSDAHAELVRQAHAIGDPARRRQFFELVPLNRAIADAHAQLGLRTTTSARLARLDAPLGRVLRPDELVEITWTVHAASDAAFDGPAKRRHRMRRLLAEATAQGAAPTDDELADVLEVSRRTILRDMSVLARAGDPVATRRRRGPATGSR